MANLSVTIPHQLSRAEARRRIEEEVRRLDRSPPGGMALEHRWQGDTLDFRLAVPGETVKGQVFVEDRQVRLEAELPWMLALLGGVFKGQIEQQGRALLGHR
jgi:putative polyhydroxyalkanoate system protein